MGPARARQEGRKRRTTAEVRAAITEAALTLFAERGYGGTSTRDITTRAGVAEPLLFRHFGSKSNLFEQAVIEQNREAASGKKADLQALVSKGQTWMVEKEPHKL